MSDVDGGASPLTGRLLDELQAGVVVVDAGARIIACSHFAQSLLGLRSEDVVGRLATELLVPAPGEQPIGDLLHAAHAGRSPDGQVVLPGPNGDERRALAVVHGRRSPEGEVLGAVVFITDVRQHHENERRRHAEHAIFATLAEATTVEEAGRRVLQAICQSHEWDVGLMWLQNPAASGELAVTSWWHSTDERIEAFVQNCRMRTFVRGEGIPGRVWESGRPEWIPDVLSHPDFPRAMHAAPADLHGAFAVAVASPDECLGVLEFFSSEIREPDPDLLRMMATTGTQVGMFLERRRAEQAVRASEARKTAMFEAALDCIVTIDHEGVVVEFNPAAEEVFGYTRDEAVGRVMADLIVPDQLRDQHLNGVRRYVETGIPRVMGQRIELPARHKDGHEFPVELTITRVDLPGAPLFTGYLRDITQRKRVQGELDRVKDELATQLDDMTRLHELSVRLSTSPQLSAVAYEVLSAATELQGASMGVLMLWDEERRRLHAVSAQGVEGACAECVEALCASDWFADSLAARARVVVPNIEEHPELAHEVSICRAADVQAVFSTPLITFRGYVLGGLTTLFSEVHAPSERDIRRVELFTRQAAEALDNARLYERERRTAETLQRSLLPDRLPDVAGLETRARYLPGGAGVEVGGDWYDVISLPKGQVAFALGDVVGRGVRAASIMGQIRMALRAYALEGHTPSRVVRRVDRLMQRLDQSHMATLLYLVLDLESDTARIVNAGHPPPLVRTADGTVKIVPAPRSVPLGVVSHPTHQEGEVDLTEGSTLLLYTDGLIERRGETIDLGLDRLAQAFASGPDDLDALCDHILGRMLSSEEAADDVALLAVHLTPVRAATFELRLSNNPEVLASLRRLLSRWLTGFGLNETSQFELITACGEACANAVEHAYGGGEGDFEVCGRAVGDTIVLSVRDFGAWRTQRIGDRGRGLDLIAALVDDLKVTQHEDGTEVTMTRKVDGVT